MNVFPEIFSVTDSVGLDLIEPRERDNSGRSG